ncbi:putative inhibitor of apoptosis [Hylaeus anthracinus]|uniref:putative inhibitor of apoptosis n=1 Tax=Hylaeus anthracinus TaxID=313031 RepID=UPI0023BA2D0F|nr:putative inhibitor of apoptosis [Hylaeus anthracinus]
MNVEENRLQTFTNWPENAAVDAARIAKAGFYYSGQAVEVQCFLCGIKISDWNYSDQAMVRHREAAPDCPFVQNPSNTCNVPLIPMSSTNLGLASTSTEALQGNDIVKHQSVTPSLERKEPRKEYRTILQRWNSFVNWPISSIVSPEKLAKAGFYYLQCNDKVQCAYCGCIMEEWESNNDPYEEHRKHFPECDFYLQKDEDDTFYLKNVKLMPGATSSLKDLGIQVHTASKIPNHATYEGRLQTFRGWPKNIKQIPEVLASAGFYYTGIADHVRCFHCDGGLLQWEATDNAWIAHARLFPKCEFVNLVRGQEFIKHCIDTRPPLDPSILEGVAKDESPGVAEVKKPLKKRMEEFGIPYANSDHLINERVVEDDSRSELSTSLVDAVGDHIDNPTEQYKDDEVHNNQQTTIENENETLNEEEKSELSNGEDSAFKRMTNIILKETAFLEEENRNLKEARLCKTCLDREVAVAFLPCGHLATCISCALPLTHCLLCREEIRATVRTFLS